MIHDALQEVFCGIYRKFFEFANLLGKQATDPPSYAESSVPKFAH